MYLEGDAETFGDLDLLIGQGWMDAARQALRTAGAQELAPRPPSDVYLTEQFCECRLDQVDFDLLCGFAVRREGVAYRYPFEARRIVKTVAVLGENVPLSPPADWYVLYRLMPDHGDKADVIARRLAARPREEWAPWWRSGFPAPSPTSFAGGCARCSNPPGNSARGNRAEETEYAEADHPRENTRTEYRFTGTPTLAQALAAAGFALPLPCGGRGTCGNCAVLALTGEASPPNGAETRFGARLACQAKLTGDCDVTLPPEQRWAAIETAAAAPERAARCPGATARRSTWAPPRWSRASTTCKPARRSVKAPAQPADRRGRGRDGAHLGRAGGRGAAAGSDGEGSAGRGRGGGLRHRRGVPGADAWTVGGNTTMLYLLTGRNPRPLAGAPFEPDTRFGVETELCGANVYLPPCAGAFMGADLTCAALATGLCDQSETTLLMDIGTNGELMLWHDGRLYAASASAGPAFEGGEISQGLGGVAGAIDKVWVENGGLGSRVIGGGEARGLCGSGLIDAVAALLRLGRIDETGASDASAFTLRDGVRLTAADVRAVQLAKAAVAAAAETLFAEAGITASQVHRLWLAGGFGSRLNVASAAAVGLIPAALAGRASAVGNAALAGAAALLMDVGLREKAERIASGARVVPLGGDEGFEQRFLAAMNFPHMR
jgi:ferredoxin